LADISILQQTLKVSFNNPALLEQALIHSSYFNENPDIAPASNERLEFLGDAVLDMIVAEKLYQSFPHLNEGEMTKRRAALVCRDTLARMARAIGLGEYLYLGKGEEASGGRKKPANLASTLEALIAAIYLDNGFSVTSEFILRLLDTELHKTASQNTGSDYKSKLQEVIQAREQRIPAYHVIAVTGPDHDKQFTIEVRLGKTALGRGSGKNKKAAETEAARSALDQLPELFTQ